MGKLVSFLQALERSGSSDYERARVLNIPRKTVELWRKGQLPPALRRVARNPQLAEALLEDARAGRWNHTDESAA